MVVRLTLFVFLSFIYVFNDSVARFWRIVVLRVYVLFVTRNVHIITGVDFAGCCIYDGMYINLTYLSTCVYFMWDWLKCHFVLEVLGDWLMITNRLVSMRRWLMMI